MRQRTNPPLPGKAPIPPEQLMHHVISVEQAAVQLWLSMRQVRDLCRAGVIDAKQLGREWAVSLPSVLALQQERTAAKERRFERCSRRGRRA